MNFKELKADFEKFRRSYALIIERNAQLEKQYEQQEERIALLSRCLENCQKALDINKSLMRQISAEHDKKENSLVELLTALKAKLRDMGYNGNFDRLGQQNN